MLPTVLRMSQHEEHDLKPDRWLRVGLFCDVQLSRKLETTSSGECYFLPPLLSNWDVAIDNRITRSVDADPKSAVPV